MKTMTDAPERVWRSSGGMWYFEPPENLQTIEYIRADIHEDTHRWAGQMDALAEERLAKLTKALWALRYYAHPDNYTPIDGGRLARRTLKELETDHDGS